MPEPYTAVGLIPTVRGVRKRAEIQRNLDHIAHLIAAASWLSSLDLPVRLVAIPEGALQGFNDEVFDLDHVTYARECAIDIPGPETRLPRRPGPALERLHHGPGQGAPRGVPGPLLQRRLRDRPAGRDHPQALQAGDALPGRALGDAARCLGPAGSSCTAAAGRLLPGGGHRDRPAGRADGQRGLAIRRTRAGWR